MTGWFTWNPNIRQDSLLSVFNAADLGKVDVQSQKRNTAEESHGAHKHAIVTRILVAVKDAVLLHLIGAVDVALIGDTAENHDGEKLKRGNTNFFFKDTQRWKPGDLQAKF